MNALLKKRIKKKAKQSICRYKIGAIAFNKKGEVLGTSSNIQRFNNYGGSIHAEMKLMKQYGTKIKTIIICRVGNSDCFLPIHPCNVCKKKASELGIVIRSIT